MLFVSDDLYCMPFFSDQFFFFLMCLVTSLSLSVFTFLYCSVFHTSPSFGFELVIVCDTNWVLNKCVFIKKRIALLKTLQTTWVITLPDDLKEKRTVCGCKSGRLISCWSC